MILSLTGIPMMFLYIINIITYPAGFIKAKGAHRFRGTPRKNTVDNGGGRHMSRAYPALTHSDPSFRMLALLYHILWRLASARTIFYVFHDRVEFFL